MEEDEALKRFPLPEGVPDALLNKREAGEFFAVSAPTLSEWQRDGMPHEVEGTNGREWEFRASRIWAWKCARDAGEKIKRDQAAEAVRAMRLKLLGGDAGDSEMAMPAEERRKLYAVQTEHMRMRSAANELIPRLEVEDGYAELMALFRDGIGALPDMLEREAGLQAKAVALAIEAGDALLETLAKQVEKFFEARPVKAVAGRVDLFQ